MGYLPVSRGFRAILLAVAPAGLVLAAAVPANAQVFEFDQFRVNLNQQTGPSAIVPLNGGANYFFESSSFGFSATDFDSMTTTAPGGTVYTHSPAVAGGGIFSMSYSSILLTKSVLDATYPAGTYTVNASNSVTGATLSVELNYNGTDHYPAPPQLTPATYRALNGLNPATDFTLA